MVFYKQALLVGSMAVLGTVCQAQVGVQKSVVHYARRPQQQEEATPITNQETGQRVTMEQYEQLVKADPFAYHLVPDYDAFGQPKAYTMRTATPEEHETHRFRDRDPAKQPKGGQTIAPFVMKGVDGKTYQSADLVGKVVILNFWVSLDKSVWDEKQAASLAEVLRPYQGSAAPVVLGVFNSEHPAGMSEADVKKLPFVPVPNAYGFHNKYHITTVPTVLVLDKTGKVAANLQGPGSYDKLKQVLAMVTQ